MNEKTKSPSFSLFIHLSGRVFDMEVQSNFIDYDGLISVSCEHENDKF